MVDTGMASSHGGLPRLTGEQRAFDLVIHLEGLGTKGAAAEEVMLHFDWTRAQFDRALTIARDRICPDLSLVIPHPVPTDGWRYRITGQWLHADNTPAIEAGTAYAIGIIEARLHSVYRDVRVARNNLDGRSVEGRKCNYLSKHLEHILRTLAEIGQVPPEAISDEG